MSQDEIEALLGAQTFSQKKRDEVSDEIYTLCTYQSVGQRVVWSQVSKAGPKMLFLYDVVPRLSLSISSFPPLSLSPPPRPAPLPPPPLFFFPIRPNLREKVAKER